MLFKSPKLMTDDELCRERVAARIVVDDVLSCDEVSDYFKREVLEHQQSVEAEYTYRRYGECKVPLSMFGIADF